MPKEDTQSKLWDRTIESPELESAIELIMDNKLDPETQTAVNAARKTIKQLTEQYELTDGQRLRVGRYVIHGKQRAGGGFNVPTWSKTTVGNITELEA
jgi:hypothetical protein